MDWKIIYLGIIVSTLLLTLKNRKYLIYGYVFFIPWMGLKVDIGVDLYIDRILSGFMLVLLITSVRDTLRLKSLLLFLMYSFIATFSLSQFLPETVYYFPPLRGEFRWVGQIIIWCIMFAPVFYLQKIKNFKELEVIYNVLLVSVLILCGLGLIQLLIFQEFHYDVLPIGLFDPQIDNRSAALTFHNLPFLRISSLGGEPKHLAYSIVVAFNVVFINTLFRSSTKSRYKNDIIIIVFLLTSLLFTFSSQGFALIPIDVALILIFSSYKLKVRKIQKPLMLVFPLVAMFCLLIYLEPRILDLLNQRTFERISENGYVEDFNEAVLGFLLANKSYIILGVGLGNIHFYAQDFIPAYALHYMSNQVFVAKSGFLRLTSEIGIIGFLFFSYVYFKPLIALQKIKHSQEVLSIFNKHYSLCIIVFLNYLITANGPPFIVLMMALSYSIYNLCKKYNNSQFDSRIKQFAYA